MTTIIEGITTDEFFTAMNANSAELAVNCSADIDCMTTLSSTMTGIDFVRDVNHNFRNTVANIGSLSISNINSSFGQTISRFQDDYVEKAIDVELAAEPTALVSEDGERLDVWFTGGVGEGYAHTTDGVNFTLENTTGLSGECGYVFKDGETYYMMRRNVIDNYNINLLTSINRKDWTDQGSVFIGGVGLWDQTLGNPCFWKEDGVWYLIYEAYGPSNAWMLGLATAPAVTGPWTKYEGNPLISGLGEGVGSPEIIRKNGQVLKHNGEYYLYYHFDNHDYVYQQNNYRAHSTDLHTWTIEGPILNVHHEHEIATRFRSYGDVAIVEFKGKSYLFWSACGEAPVNPCHIDLGIDNRPLAEILALYP